MRIRGKTKIKILIVLSAFSVVFWSWIFSYQNANKLLKVDFFDVGQGDSIFIETPDNRQILIDGGPGLAVLDKLGKEMPFWDRYIDLVVLTHPEYDHMSGLIETAKRYKIGAIFTNGVIRDTADFKEWQNIIQRKHIPVFVAKLGGIARLNDREELKIIYPLKSLSGKRVKKSNNTSVVSQFVYKNFKVLLTGDIEKEAENKLMSSKINLQSDILKVPHHGSKTSSTKEFLMAVKPAIAVIQVGKNNHYGHPNQNVLNRLKKFAKVLRTDKKGDIEILSDGAGFRIK